MKYEDFVKKLQSAINEQGESLTVDGDPGPKTKAALLNFDVQLVLSKRPEIQVPVPDGSTHLSPIDWARGEIGQKEIAGSKDNPRIRWYHTHCANLGSKEYPDEVPWCSSFINAAADECGMEKSDNALASSWEKYSVDTGDQVDEGDIIVIKRGDGGRHVTMANKPFSRSKDKTFEGLGGNQSNSVNISTYSVSNIVAARKWKAKGGTVTGKITTGQDADEGTAPWYRRMWAACEIDPGKESYVKNCMALIEKGMGHYLKVSSMLNAKDAQNFAYILGVIHFKEASCDFRGVLHNGEKIVGTGKKTTIVPAGRGPFATWEDAAVDAIGIESSRWKVLLAGGDDIGDILYSLERYNGTGYIKGAGKAENSPYLWACSNINDGKGKYVSDGKFDPNAGTDSTVGAALLLKEFAKAGKFQVS